MRVWKSYDLGVSHDTFEEALLMKKFAFLMIFVISRVVLMFSTAEKMPEFFRGCSLETVKSGVCSNDLAPTFNLKRCFEPTGFHLSMADYLNTSFGVSADFATHVNNRIYPFSTATGEFKFSLSNFCGSLKIRFPDASRLTPLAREVVDSVDCPE